MPPFTGRNQARADTPRKDGTAIAWTVIVASVLLALPLYAATWVLIWIPFGAAVPPLVALVLTIFALVAIGRETSRPRGTSWPRRSAVAFLALLAAIGVWIAVLLPYWQWSDQGAP
ncbi:hypothetical protein [Agromyces cerinus]|uniref:Uncharacterized protein n=1 Tax=Agromyces cerinus subsp. cerinus TaxID=232089 RepID=A0A1N6G2Z3_9MICO|nr:hypothetical protein [Agromyces cerinus]SIO01867.1 hypothetical protein SAMN05443544_2248 [Agromyces cerinus subsp. cerinus]